MFFQYVFKEIKVTKKIMEAINLMNPIILLLIIVLAVDVDKKRGGWLKGLVKSPKSTG